MYSTRILYVCFWVLESNSLRLNITGSCVVVPMCTFKHKTLFSTYCTEYRMLGVRVCGVVRCIKAQNRTYNWLDTASTPTVQQEKSMPKKEDFTTSSKGTCSHSVDLNR